MSSQRRQIRLVHTFLGLLIVSLITPTLQANDPLTPARFTEAETGIRVDGVLNEAVWERLTPLGAMQVLHPDTLAQTSQTTDVRLFYTDKGLYVGFWNQQPATTIVERLSPRDKYISRDGNFITIDPSGAGLYGYWFGINLGGTLMDGTVLPERQYSNQWDGPWRGASARVEGGWSTEFFIPWSMMTMPDTADARQQLGIYVSRQVAHANEVWGFPALPETQPVFLANLQKLEIESISSKQQLVLYPYASTAYDNIAETGQHNYKAGLDVFWRPTTNTQISATLNPDFGNVESDNVVVNLTSLETFFPEKRAFFLECNEVFSTTPRANQNRGGPPTTLINTRRIGGPPKTTKVTGLTLTGVEENRPSELIGALKMTGQTGQLRYGTLAAFEEDTLLRGQINNTPATVKQLGRDFAAARLLYEDTSGGARRSIGWLGTLVAHPQNDALVNGIDAHYLTSDGQWNLDLQFMFSDVAEVKGEGAFADVSYTPSQGRKHSLAIDYFSDDLQINDFGFMERNDLIGARYGYQRDDSGFSHFKSQKTQFKLVHYYNTEGLAVKRGIFSSRERQLNNNDFYFVELNYFPARWDDITSEGNGNYSIDGRIKTGAFYSTDEAKTFSTQVGLNYTEEAIGGSSKELELALSWRPTDRFSLQAGIGFEDTTGWLLHYNNREFSTFNATFWGPNLEADFFLSARQQFRVTAQWAGIKAFEDQRWRVPEGDGRLVRQAKLAAYPLRDFTISRLTFQARYRWEIAPLSDLFVVYTRGSNIPSRPGESFDNLLTDSWTERLVDVFVVKLRYRLGN